LSTSEMWAFWTGKLYFEFENGVVNIQNFLNNLHNIRLRKFAVNWEFLLEFALS